MCEELSFWLEHGADDPPEEVEKRKEKEEESGPGKPSINEGEPEAGGYLFKPQW